MALISPELAVARVKHRVRMGGHDVPEEIVRRRLRRSLMNLFELYLPVADRWRVFDSSAGAKPTKIAEQSTSLRIYARKKWLHPQIWPQARADRKAATRRRGRSRRQRGRPEGATTRFR